MRMPRCQCCGIQYRTSRSKSEVKKNNMPQITERTTPSRHMICKPGKVERSQRNVINAIPEAGKGDPEPVPVLREWFSHPHNRW